MNVKRGGGAYGDSHIESRRGALTHKCSISFLHTERKDNNKTFAPLHFNLLYSHYQDCFVCYYMFPYETDPCFSPCEKRNS